MWTSPNIMSPVQLLCPRGVGWGGGRALMGPMASPPCPWGGGWGGVIGGGIILIYYYLILFIILSLTLLLSCSLDFLKKRLPQADTGIPGWRKKCNIMMNVNGSYSGAWLTLYIYVLPAAQQTADASTRSIDTTWGAEK